MKKLFYVMMIALIIASIFLAACSTAPKKEESNEFMLKDNKSEFEHTQDVAVMAIADGIYETESTYAYHAGEETVSISVTFADNVITAISVEPSENAHSVSQKYINGVDAGLQDLVIGKSLDEVDIPDQISGSSLTTGVVKDYLAELKSG